MKSEYPALEFPSIPSFAVTFVIGLRQIQSDAERLVRGDLSVQSSRWFSWRSHSKQYSNILPDSDEGNNAGPHKSKAIEKGF